MQFLDGVPYFFCSLFRILGLLVPVIFGYAISSSFRSSSRYISDSGPQKSSCCGLSSVLESHNRPIE